MSNTRLFRKAAGISNVIMNVWLIILHYIMEWPWLPVVAVLSRTPRALPLWCSW